jgi:hypothetical protein
LETFNRCWSSNSKSVIFSGATVGSSEKIKKDIKILEPGVELFEKIKAYEFKYIGENRKKFGFIAERLIESGLDDLVDFDPDGEPLDVDFRSLTGILWNTVNYQNKKIEDLEQRIIKLENI